MDFANSLNIPTSSPFSTGRGAVDSESPEVDGAGGGCPFCNLEGPAAVVAMLTTLDQVYEGSDDMGQHGVGRLNHMTLVVSELRGQNL